VYGQQHSQQKHFEEKEITKDKKRRPKGREKFENKKNN
jgi:hypothetical protein